MQGKDNADGDFKQLAEVKKLKKEERDQRRQNRQSDINANTSEGKGPDVIKDDVLQVGGTTQTNNNTQASDESELRALQTDLFSSALIDDIDKIRELLIEIENRGISISNIELCEPETHTNVLHHALQNSAITVARELIATQSQEVLLQEFEVIVRKLPSKKTTLHLLTELGNISLIKMLLDKFPEGETKDKLLKQEVLMEIEGQRPRHLSSIHIAALKGHTHVVEYLVGLGIDPNTINVKNDTPVLWASRFSRIDTVRSLIKLGADLNHQNDKGSTPLYWACRYGLEDMVNVLITEGKADVHQERKLGLISPIVLVSALGYTSIAKILLDNGAKVNLKIQNGYSPLHHAAENGNEDTIELLLDYGALINDETDFGDTALQLAANAHELEAVDVLASHGANLENINKDGKSVWHYAIEAPSRDLLILIVKWFKRVKRMPKGKLILKSGKTPLHIAAMKEDVVKLQCLLDLGAESDAVDEAGNTFFHLAARENSVDVLECFIDIVDVNSQNAEGETPLHIACRHGHMEAVKMLVRKVKVDMRNESGETALHVACKSNLASPEMVDHIVDTIVKAHNWSLVDSTDNYGNTALHIAARAGRPDIMEFLSPLSPKVANHHGDSPLHLAVKGGNAEVLDSMLQIFRKELNINQQNYVGNTLLHIAAKFADSMMVELLIYSGADLAVGNIDGNTPLHLIVEQSVLNVDKLNLYLDVFNTVVGSATHWFCMGKDQHYPDEESELFTTYKRNALLYLTNDISNNDGLTVLQLAAHTGALKIMETLLQIPDVYMIVKDNQYDFDVTTVTPDTIENSMRQKRMVRGAITPSDVQPIVEASDGHEEGNFKTATSCLELIVSSGSIQVASEMLDIVPIKQIVSGYWSVYQWIYGVLMVVHVLYMGLYSAYAIPLISSAHSPVNVTLTRGHLSVQAFPYGLFLIWPLVLLAYEIYYVGNRIFRCSKGSEKLSDKRKPTGLLSLIYNMFLLMSDYLSHMSSVTFSLLVISWYILYLLEDISQIGVLATSLIVGWMFSIVFTSGFEAVQSFSIMLKNIIIRDMMRFFVIYLFVLLAFTFAFEALFWWSDSLKTSYPTIWHVAFVVFNMMIGMGEIFPDDFDLIYKGLGLSSIGHYTKVVYLFYIVLTTIIMLNLLIAMMTDSYSAVKQKEGTTWRVGSLRLAIQLEKSLPFVPKFLALVGVRANNIKYDMETERWMMHIKQGEVDLYNQAKETEVMKVLKRLDKDMTHMKNNLVELHERVEKLSTTVEKANFRPTTPRLLKALRNKRMSNVTALTQK